MATLNGSIAIGDQTPGTNQACGGGMIVGIYIPTGAAGTDYTLEYSPDGGTTWDPVTDEAGTILTVTYLAGGLMAQINPPVRAPLFRINSDTNETAIINYEVHTV